MDVDKVEVAYGGVYPIREGWAGAVETVDQADASCSAEAAYDHLSRRSLLHHTAGRHPAPWSGISGPRPSYAVHIRCTPCKRRIDVVCGVGVGRSVIALPWLRRSSASAAWNSLTTPFRGCRSGESDLH